MRFYRVLPLSVHRLFCGGGLPRFTTHGWIDLNKNGRKNVYEDPSQPVDKRVNDLLKRMTLDEKIGQLWQAPWSRIRTRNSPAS